MLTAFRTRYYSGRSIAAELARQGYVVIAIDMLYWGERRMMYAADPEALRDRSLSLTQADIDAFHRRCSQNEQLLARPAALYTEPQRMESFSAAGPHVDYTIKPDLAAVGGNLYTAAQSLDPLGAVYDASGYHVERCTSFSAPA